MRNFSAMHADYLDAEDGDEEVPDWWETMRENCKFLLDSLGCENWGRFYRSVYKGTGCGPTIGILCHGQDDPVYCDDLYKFNKDSPVVKVFVSSIVEGVETGTQQYIVDMKLPGAAARFWKAVEDVDAEATQLWIDAEANQHE